MGDYTEIVCTPEGCIREVNVLAWAMDHPVIAAGIGIVLCMLLAWFLWNYFQLWRRPRRAIIITLTAVWVGIGFALWPFVGALPLAIGAFIVLLPLSWFFGWVLKDVKPEPYWCEICEEEYPEGACPIHD